MSDVHFLKMDNIVSKNQEKKSKYIISAECFFFEKITIDGRGKKKIDPALRAGFIFDCFRSFRCVVRLCF